jgi:hypothetical protein
LDSGADFTEQWRTNFERESLGWRPDREVQIDTRQPAMISKSVRRGIATLGRIVSVAALLSICGGHWLLLQSVAWSGMIIKYSRDAPLAVAVAKTFDGAHPCSLCHVVKKGRASEKKSALQSVSPRIDLICVQRSFGLKRPSVRVPYALTDLSADEICFSPPIPIPRAA